MSEDLKGLNLIELIDELDSVPEPSEISLWPQTAGWLWLALLILTIAIYFGHLGLRRYRANAYRRAAMIELETIADNPVALAALARRTALAAYPREKVAGLHGEAWLEFLDLSYGGSEFRHGPGRVIATAAYQPDQSAPGLAKLVRNWISKHRADKAVR